MCRRFVARPHAGRARRPHRVGLHPQVSPHQGVADGQTRRLLLGPARARTPRLQRGWAAHPGLPFPSSARPPARPPPPAPPTAPPPPPPPGSRDQHQPSDTPLDPHSPYEGFWWSHILWLTGTEHSCLDYANVPDLKSQLFYR